MLGAPTISRPNACRPRRLGDAVPPFKGAQGLGVHPDPPCGLGDGQAEGDPPRADSDPERGIRGYGDRGLVPQFDGDPVPLLEFRDRRALLPPAIRRGVDAVAPGHGGAVEAEFEAAAGDVVAEVAQVLPEPGGGGLGGSEGPMAERQRRHARALPCCYRTLTAPKTPVPLPPAATGYLLVEAT